MKLLIKQYLTSLRERDELDAILPDLLSQSGYQVQSRPGRGAKQYGVDLWALRTGADGSKRVFLFTVKAGNLTRKDWDDGTPQALRPSLNQMLTVFARTHLPKAVRDLPIVVAIVCGGNIDETVRLELTCYQDQLREQTPDQSVSFEEWHGDRLTDMIFDAFLREDLLPIPLRSSLRKALAMVDEPEASITHFSTLIETIFKTACDGDVKTRIMGLRQMQMCLWILYKWAGDAGNLEAPQRCSLLVTLRTWELCRNSLGKKKKDDKVVEGLLSRAVGVQATIADAYVDKITPACGVLHGIGMAVGSITSVDVNLKLFDLVGRLALHGLWLNWFANTDPESDLAKMAAPKALNIGHLIAETIQNNPAMRTPIMDAQALDINLAFLFLMTVGQKDVLRNWLGDMVGGITFAHMRQFRYPSMVHDYQGLLRHPKVRDEAYQQEVTASSILYPTLAIWAELLSDVKTRERLADFTAKHMSHCSFQAWFPDEESDQKLFGTNDNSHGMANTDLKITRDGVEPFKGIADEIKAYNGLEALGPAKYGLFPLVLQACRYNDMPSPPQYWLFFKQDDGASSSEVSGRGTDKLDVS